MAIKLSQARRAMQALNDLRKVRGTVSQTEFWARYGVTQSGGSRYESGRDMDKPLKTLMILHITGQIDSDTLSEAMQVASL